MKQKMDNNIDIDKKTARIDKLINKTNSGKNAWTAGKLLYEVRKFREYLIKNEIATFAEYLNSELKISETKADSYINVFLTYDEDDISTKILVSHLLYLKGQNQNIREVMLKALKGIDNLPTSKIPFTLQSNNMLDFNSSVQTENKTVNNNLRPVYDSNILIMSVNFLNSAGQNGKKITDDLAKKVIEVAIEIDFRNTANRKIPNKTGSRIYSSHFPTLHKLFEYEPVLEMGLVGLFCTMLHLIKELKFQFNKTTNLRFKSIQYVRDAFPDSAIRFIDDKNNEIVLTVEFELNTTNYLKHEHHKDKRECDLIIAWDHDLPKSKIEEFGQKIPPVIAIKEVIETGKIILR